MMVAVGPLAGWVFTAAAAVNRYAPPLSGSLLVVTDFDPPSPRWQRGHRGVDVAATEGTAVLAVSVGTVRYAGDVAGKPVVSIEHPDGITTTYEPVRAQVRSGQPVAQGDPIGAVLAGHPSCVGAVCLHWGARRGSGHNASYINPLGLIGAIEITLKPFEH